MGMETTVIEDIYPLSPMQLGLLSHVLHSPRSRAYISVFSCDLIGRLDTGAFEQAWRDLLSRHAVLRTAFDWEDPEEPLQIVFKQVPLPLDLFDWRHLSPGGHEQRLSELKEQERQRGFDLERPPALRLVLVRLEEELHRLFWSHHHILLDGWCRPILFRELSQLYEASVACREARLPRQRPYRDYIAWWQRQSFAPAETFWRRQLIGVRSEEPTTVHRGTPATAEAQLRREFRLAETTSRDLERSARARQVTLSTLVQGAWALALGAEKGVDRLVIGVVVSGRPADLAEVESMVGVFINTLPLRLDIPREGDVTPWLQKMQAQLAEANQHAYLPLWRICKCSGLPPGQELFDGVLAFENYPVDSHGRDGAGGLRFEATEVDEASEFSLTLVVEPSTQLSLALYADAGRSSESLASRLLVRLRRALETLAAGGAAFSELTTSQDPSAAEAPQNGFQVDELAARRVFWADRLANVPAVVELPMTRRDRSPPTQLSARKTLTLGPAAASYLEAQIQRAGAPLLAGLGAGVAGLLSHYTGHEELCFAISRTDRSTSGEADGAGHLANLALVRIGMADGPNFRTLVERVAAELETTLQRVPLPYALLLEALDVEVGDRHLPWAQVLLSAGWREAPEAELEGDRARLIRSAAMPAFHDLCIDLEHRADDLILHARYRQDLFEGTTVDRLLGHLRQLLLASRENPDGPVRSFSLLGVAECHQVCWEWSGKRRSFDVELGLADLFDRSVRTRQDSVAVSCGEEYLSYSGLAAAVDRLAAALNCHGVSSEDRVGILLDRSLDMVVAIVAVLRSGGAYVPLESQLPDERLRFMVRDSGADVVVTREALAGRLEGVRCLCLERIGTVPPDIEWPTLPPASLAYVIYTSGSTGIPKGVGVTHANAVRLLRATEELFSFGSDDVWTLFHSYAFDFSVWELWGALAYGGHLVMVSRRLSRSPEALFAFLLQQRVTVLNLTPSTFRQLMPVAAADRRVGRGALALRWVIFGGEALAPASLMPWFARYGDAKPRLINMYGITETTVHVTHRPLVVADAYGDGASVIGEPIFDLRTVLLGVRGEPVPIGLPGEIHVAGAGLARGYLGRPGLTAMRFVPDPWSREPGRRLYRSGDLARYRFTGNLEYLGRLDHQVKIRGFRIELGEIEMALVRHPSVREAVVVVHPQGEGRRLVAYVVPAGQAPSVTDLRRFLGSRLPEYMVPALFIELVRLPLTANGKVDRLALPEPEGERSVPTEEFVAPRNAIERTLVGLWREVLGIEKVSIHDSFFALGGDSILSIQLAARARALELDVAPWQVFEHETVASLAPLLIKVEESPKPRLETAAGAVPLTPIQRWFFDHEFAAPWHWNLPLLLAIRRPLDPGRLNVALNAVVAAHDVFRITFRGQGPTARQELHAEARPLPWARADLSRLKKAERNLALSAAARSVQGSLDLGRPPLLAAVFFDFGDEQRLLLVGHHLVVDGVSWRILVRDLEIALQHRAQASTMASDIVPFAAWARHLAEQPSEFAARSQPWEDAGSLPLDDPDGHNSEISTRTVDLLLSAVDTNTLLHDFPRILHSQVQEVLLTALSQALVAWQGSDGALLEVEGHGRSGLDGIDPSHTVGWLTSLHPLVLKPHSEDPAVALRAIKGQLRDGLGGLTGHGLPTYPGDVDATAGTPPRAQVLFNFLGRLDMEQDWSSMFKLASEDIGPSVSPRATRSHILEVSARVQDSRLGVRFSYSAALHRPSTIESLVARFRRYLRSLLALAGQAGLLIYKPSDFPLARLDQRALDGLIASMGMEIVEDIYPLSPLQHGMLFHNLFERGRSLYMAQFVYELSGELDRPAFARAWQQLFRCHSMLRTVFCWEELDEPVQVVIRNREGPWSTVDWSASPPAEHRSRLEAFLEADRSQGFKNSWTPHVRLTLVRTAIDQHHLVLSFHLALLDGWSLPLLFEDFFALYAAEVAGEPCVLQERRPFRDYIAWLEGQDRERSEAFWRNTFAGYSAPSSFLPKRPMEERRDARSEGKLELALSTIASARLQELAFRCRWTLSTIVRGAWALLLSRYGRTGDVVFGAVVSGRPAELSGIESMVGLFINTLPVRVRVDERRALLDWLQELQVGQKELQIHEHSPLAEIQRWADITPGRTLFESVLVFQNYPVKIGHREAGRMRIRQQYAVESTHYPLMVIVAPEDGLLVKFSFQHRWLDEPTAQRLLRHFIALLEDLAVRPNARLAEIEHLTIGERHQLLLEWNDTAGEQFADQCLHDLLAVCWEQHPDAVALVFGSDYLTYNELGRQARNTASVLAASGAGPESRIVVLGDRSPSTAVAICGVLQSGAAFVYLDPALPQRRFAHILASVRPQWILCRRELVATLPKDAAKIVLDLAGLWLTTTESADSPVAAVSEDQLAYIVFTSGSTGVPKGIAATHRSAVKYLGHLQERWSLGPSDVVLQLAPWSFDAAVRDLLGPLASGAQVVLTDGASAKDPAVVLKLLEKRRITTVLSVVPTRLGSLLDVAEERGSKALALRLVLSSGEALPTALGERFASLFGAGVELVNQYGPSECTMTSSFCRWSRGEAQGSSTVGLGQPIPDTRIYLLDRRMEPVAIGAVGEIYIAGEGTARGYFAQPTLTAERFIPDPFSRRPGMALYRTGDLARCRPHGSPEFLGRSDQQIKVRGHRVETAEIEAILRRYPGIRAAVVAAAPDRHGQTCLVAYLVPGQGLGNSELREFLRQWLPEYMIPSAFVDLDTLPMTPNGKVDRRRLPAFSRLRPEDGRYVAPRSPFEERIAVIWREVLGLDQVGVHDDFFDLGGHSLLATQLVSRVRRTFGTELTLRSVFEHPTVEDQAREVAQLRAARLDAAEVERLLHELDELPDNDRVPS